MGMYGGLYGGVRYIGALVNNIDQINKLDEQIQDIVSAKKEDSVVSIFQMPYPFFSDGINPVIKLHTVARPTHISGYVPRNKKLFTYPYMFLTVDTINDSHDYRFEQSWNENKSISFRLVCGMSPNPEIVVYPTMYNGFSVYNPTESVSCSGFPQCAFSIDTFRAWVAQKAFGQFSGLFGAAVATGAGIATGGLAAGVIGAVGIAASIANIVKDSTQGSKTRGNQGASTDVAIREKGVYFKQMCVNPESARMIDDFFDRYGYSCCRIKIPNRRVRPYWTYTKTQNCSLSGFVPVEHLAKIKSIYDKGITFWKEMTHVGNYSLDNRV